MFKPPAFFSHPSQPNVYASTYQAHDDTFSLIYSLPSDTFSSNPHKTLPIDRSNYYIVWYGRILEKIRIAWPKNKSFAAGYQLYSISIN